MTQTIEYTPFNISFYKNQWYHFFKINKRPEYISSIMLRAPHRYVSDVYLKYNKYIQGLLLNNQQIVFFTDSDDTDVGVAPLNEQHVMEIVITVSKPDIPVNLLVTGYDLNKISGIENLDVWYTDGVTKEKKPAKFNYNLIYELEPYSPSESISVSDTPLPNTPTFYIKTIPYKTFDDEKKVVIYLDELADIYHKFYVYMPNYTPPNYVTDRRAKGSGVKILKKYIHIYRFICNNEIISEFNHGSLLNTEEPDLYELQFFMTEAGAPLNLPCKLAQRTNYRIELEFSEAIPGVKSLCFFAELGDYANSNIQHSLNIQESTFNVKGSTPIEMKIRGGLVSFLFMLQRLNKSKSCFT